MHVTIKLPQARVNANDKVAVSFESDWSRRWREFSGSIIEPCKPNPVKSRITIDTRLKTVLTGILFVLGQMVLPWVCQHVSRKQRHSSRVSQVKCGHPECALLHDNVTNNEILAFTAGLSLLCLSGWQRTMKCRWNLWLELLIETKEME